MEPTEALWQFRGGSSEQVGGFLVEKKIKPGLERQAGRWGKCHCGNKRKIRERQGGEKSRACLGTDEPVVEGGGSPRKALENQS